MNLLATILTAAALMAQAMFGCPCHWLEANAPVDSSAGLVVALSACQNAGHHHVDRSHDESPPQHHDDCCHGCHHWLPSTAGWDLDQLSHSLRTLRCDWLTSTVPTNATKHSLRQLATSPPGFFPASASLRAHLAKGVLLI